MLVASCCLLVTGSRCRCLVECHGTYVGGWCYQQSVGAACDDENLNGMSAPCGWVADSACLVATSVCSVVVGRCHHRWVEDAYHHNVVGGNALVATGVVGP